DRSGLGYRRNRCARLLEPRYPRHFWGGVVLCAFRLSHHADLAQGPQQAKLLHQLLRATHAPHLSAVLLLDRSRLIRAGALRVSTRSESSATRRASGLALDVL